MIADRGASLRSRLALQGWREARCATLSLAWGGRIVGGDPGGTAGLVCVDVPVTLDISRATWVGSISLGTSNLDRLTPAERDGVFFRKMVAAFALWGPRHCALEEPLDGASFWKGKADKRGHEQRGTQFRIGAAYALMVAAAEMQGTVEHIASYPVQKYGARQGWMPKVKGRGSRARALEMSTLAARAIKAPVSELSEHELMALGVVAYHVECLQANRMAAKIAAVRGEAWPPV